MTRGQPFFNKKPSSMFLLAAAMMASPLAFAGPFPPLCAWGCWWHPVIALGTGAVISTDLNGSKTFPIVDPITDQFFIYHGHTSTHTQSFVDVFLGAEGDFRPKWALQLGLAYDHPNDLDAKGTFIQGADVISQDQFSYKYHISVKQLLVEGKLLYTYHCIFHPYVLLGLGASSNRADDFSTNVPPFLTFTRIYSSHTETSFSYNVGVGIDFDVRKNVRLGIGYRFTDFGDVKLGKARIDTTSVPGTLSQNNLYTHEILGQVTFML